MSATVSGPRISNKRLRDAGFGTPSGSSVKLSSSPGRPQPPVTHTGPGFLEGEEPWLGSCPPVGRPDMLWATDDPPQVAAAGRVGDLVAGEALAPVPEGEALRPEPQGDLPARQPLFAVYAPMFQAGVPRDVEGAGEPDREERPLQILRFATSAGEETQNLRRAPAGILAVLVCPVFLRVVLLHPPVVRPDELFLTLRLSEELGVIA